MLLPASYADGFAPRDGQPLYPELWTGCVGAWNPGLGVTGLTLRDQSGFQNNGVLTNGPTWAASQGKYALSFDGVDDYVVSESNCNISGASARAISVWVNPRTLGDRAIVGWGSASSNNWFVLHIFQSKWYISGFANDFDTGVSASANTWQHAVVTYDSTTVTLWVNGTSIGSTAKTYATIAGPVYIGKRNLTSQLYVDGFIEDARIYNRALPPQEIRTLATRRGIAYEMAPRRRSSSAVQFNRRRRLLLGAS